MSLISTVPLSSLHHPSPPTIAPLSSLPITHLLLPQQSSDSVFSLHYPSPSPTAASVRPSPPTAAPTRRSSTSINGRCELSTLPSSLSLNSHHPVNQPIAKSQGERRHDTPPTAAPALEFVPLLLPIGNTSMCNQGEQDRAHALFLHFGSENQCLPPFPHIFVSCNQGEWRRSMEVLDAGGSGYLQWIWPWVLKARIYHDERWHGVVKARRKKDAYLTLCDSDGSIPVDGAAHASSPSGYPPCGHIFLFFGFVMGDAPLVSSSSIRA
jgi:hypothetical protein